MLRARLLPSSSIFSSSIFLQLFFFSFFSPANEKRDVGKKTLATGALKVQLQLRVHANLACVLVSGVDTIERIKIFFFDRESG